MLPLRFVPYHELGAVPNVVVDGGPTPSTRLTLSHWPGSPTPAELLDDLSAQIAFRALERPSWFEGVDVVSNNHLDQDGLASVFALVDPEAARARRDRVIDVARAGDFATFADRDSMRSAMAIAALTDPARSPLDPALFAGGYDEQCGRLYGALLERCPALFDDVAATRSLWEHEDAHLEESLAAIDRGAVRLEEHPALDLVVVTVPDAWTQRVTSRFTVTREAALHPAAVYARSDRLRVATLQGRSYRVELRYETWVMFRSRPVAPRPDLRDLATRLDALETGGASWTADPPGALTPALRVAQGETSLAPEAFCAALTAFLAAAPPAWDPLAGR